MMENAFYTKEMNFVDVALDFMVNNAKNYDHLKMVFVILIINPFNCVFQSVSIKEWILSFLSMDQFEWVDEIIQSFLTG